ncbi:MAG: 50S ribosomal protein L29, partial [Paramuribaculum sp.]|nr:50S ribosomal protein L29 [Paramuribaculum sp.]
SGRGRYDYFDGSVHETLSAISPIDSPSKITADRRMIARVKTELRQRELAGK